MKKKNKGKKLIKHTDETPKISIGLICSDKKDKIDIFQNIIEKIRPEIIGKIEWILLPSKTDASDLQQYHEILSNHSKKIKRINHVYGIKSPFLKEIQNQLENEHILFLNLNTIENALNLNEILSKKASEIYTVPLFSDQIIQKDYKSLDNCFILKKEFISYQISIDKITLFDTLQLLKEFNEKKEVIHVHQQYPFDNQPEIIKPTFRNKINFWIFWHFISPFKERNNRKAHFSFVKEHSVYRFVFMTIAVLLPFIMILLSSNAGISGDEITQHEHTVKVINYYKTFGKDSSAVIHERKLMHLYGAGFDVVSSAIINLFNIEKVYETRHLLNSLNGYLLILFCSLIVLLITKRYRAALFTMFLIFFSPRILGHSFNNPKDIPFTVGYIITIYFFIKFMYQFPKPKWTTLFWMAVGIGYSISIRIGGLLLIAYVVAFSGLFYLNKARNNILKPDQLKIAGQLLIYIVVISISGFLIGIILWPYALENPIKNPLNALSVMTNYTSSLKQVFNGEIIWSDNVPWYYTLHYITVTTPISVFLGVILSFIFIDKLNIERKFVVYFILMFTVVFPLAYIIYKNSNVYGGWRHVLFAYPALTILGGLGFEAINEKIKNQRLKFLPFVLIVLFSLDAIYHTFKNHPYQYIYFNQLAGGVNGAYGDYEMDYYYHSLKEGSEWLIENKLKNLNEDEKIIVATNHHEIVKYYFRNYENKASITYVRYYDRGNFDWDYAVIANSYINPYQQKHGYWPPENTIHEIKVDKAVVGAVIERNDKNDYLGYQAMKSGNTREAITYLKKALEANPNNEVARLNLAKIYIDSGNLDEATGIVNGTLKIYQNYDKALNLLGIIYLKKREFDHALGVFNRITQVNPKFVNAYHNIGVVLLNQKKNQQALDYFKQAIQTNPKYKPSYLAIAHILRQAGKEEEAKRYMDAANKL